MFRYAKPWKCFPSLALCLFYILTFLMLKLSRVAAYKKKITEDEVNVQCAPNSEVDLYMCEALLMQDRPLNYLHTSPFWIPSCPCKWFQAILWRHLWCIYHFMSPISQLIQLRATGRSATVNIANHFNSSWARSSARVNPLSSAGVNIIFFTMSNIPLLSYPF